MEESRRGLFRRLVQNRIVWLALVFLVIAGDYHEWQSQRTKDAQSPDALFLNSFNKWAAMCWEHTGGKSTCHVVFSYRFQVAPGDEEYAILGLSRRFATITAPLQRGTLVYWRVDALPFVETFTTQDDGAVLPPARSAKLLTEMLTGKQLTVRFQERVTGKKVEQVIFLDDFPKAYADYQALVKLPSVGAFRWPR